MNRSACRRHVLLAGFLAAAMCAFSRRAGSADSPAPSRQWTVGETILKAGPKGSFDDVAVKDPSIVEHDGQWHLFYTSKHGGDSKTRRTALGYVRASTLAGLAVAPRTEMESILGEAIIAPQVFYFSPQKLWYLIGHRDRDQGRLHRLEPVYCTNPDIEDVRGWTRPKVLETGRVARDDFWIDFWIICDEQKAHLFYADHSDSLFRMETPLSDFPGGFARAKEQLALSASGRNSVGRWSFHEASHIYHVKTTGQYLALLEGAYDHPTRKNYWDSRNRFVFGMVAERLEGPWRRIENDDQFLADPRELRLPNGQRPALHQISHPELIRAGNDERLEIEDFKLKLIFQAFDASQTPNNFDYHELPWGLHLGIN
jgi:hypothetical protein